MAIVKNLVINGIDLLDLIYPIGSIFETTKQDFDPNTAFNGTWTRIKGKVLVGVDEDDTDFASSTLSGGEKTHTLIVAEMPAHNHAIRTADGQATLSGWTNSNQVQRTGSSYDIENNSAFQIKNAGGGVLTTICLHIIQYICGSELLKSHFRSPIEKGGLV